MKHDTMDSPDTENTVLSPLDVLMQDALQAAKEHRPDRMLEALAMSGFLDGLTRRLDAKWEQMHRMDVEDCVAKAVDEAYNAISQGRKIRNLGGWLWKAANNKSHDLWKKDFEYRESNFRDLDGIAGANEPTLTDEERENRDNVDQFRREEAIRLARRLLPKIGKGQVVSVMELVIEAVEQGVPDLSTTDIGDTLGISTDAARTLLGRGFNRLYRVAREEGITLPEDLENVNQQDVE